MKITEKQTEQLLNGNHQFSQLGFSMLLTRLKSIYSNDSSEESLKIATVEINTFLDKFKGIMIKDIGIISELQGG